MYKYLVLREAFNFFFDDDLEDDTSESSHGVKIVKNQDYAEEVVPRFSDKTFKIHFRLNPDVFEILSNEIHIIDIQNYATGRDAVEIEKQLMITLWYLGNQECMRSIGDRFGLSTSTVWKIVRWNCDILLKLNRKNKYIKWPTCESAVQTSQYYANKYRFPGIIGSIDGSHIPIRKQIKSPNSYINRKGFSSVLLQGICNHKLEFLYCYTGEVGSIHDALLLRRSSLIDKVDSDAFHIDVNQHLLGDSAYPLKQWLITPYKDFGQLNEGQKIFNTVHSKCRVSIERAFGLLKGRFRRLFYIDCLKPASIVSYIIASCILHNICLQNNDMEEDYIVTDDNEEVEDRDASAEVASSQSKRDNLMNMLF